MHQSVLPLVLFITGTFNVLLIKWSDNLLGLCSDGQWRRFQHPVVQTALMFVGQLFCFVLYKIVYFLLKRRGDDSENQNFITSGEREFSALRFLYPALLDAVASVLLFTGLYLTYASSFQLLRTASIIFVGLMSSMHLNQPLTTRHWMALSTIACGLVMVVLTDTSRATYDTISLPAADRNAVLTGDLLVLCATVLHGAKYVYEEKLIKSLDIPVMQAVGWEGIFGLVIILMLAPATNFLPMSVPLAANANGVFDDLQDFVLQVRSNTMLLIPLVAFVFTCASFNVAAICITKLSSTPNRLLADGLRAVTIWTMALLFEWEHLNLLSVLAFVVLQIGLIDYRKAIFLEWYRVLMTRYRLMLALRRYADLSGDNENDAGAAAASRPADVI